MRPGVFPASLRLMQQEWYLLLGATVELLKHLHHWIDKSDLLIFAADKAAPLDGKTWCQRNLIPCSRCCMSGSSGQECSQL